MFAGLGGWHIVLILVIVLLLFGATKLPALARSVGQSARILKKEIRQETPPEVAGEAPAPTPAPVDTTPRL